MNTILTEKELITFTFRFIDIIVNNLNNNPKFKKKSAFKSIKDFARLRGIDMQEDVYTFKINDKSFVAALFDNDITPTSVVRFSQYFFIDKNFSNNKVIYIYVPSQEKYYSYDDDNLTNILYSVWNMIKNNNLVNIDCYNDDINTMIENTIQFMILTIVLYFTLEDNLDTKREINNFISKYYGSNECIYNRLIDNIYDDLFDYIRTPFCDHESNIAANFEKIVDNILDYLKPHYSLKIQYR